ncbi:MAG: phage late control D family protein [Symploca sp. SIO1B1]|nr:phage late control D family protein [Symploca sp. SIO1B1]
MPSGAKTLLPNTHILIQGKPLSPVASADLLSVTVSEDLEVPSMFELELVSWDLAKGKFTWVDDDLFEVGNEVEIKMGYDKEVKTVLVGEITGLEPEFTPDATPMLIVRGYDLRHRLLRGCQTKSFVKMKDSDIASQIARAQGLSPKVSDSKVIQEYVLQHNLTDWEFLQERALRIGYEVVVENKDLYFRPHLNDTQKALTLKYNEDLTEFLPRLSTMGLVQSVEVRGWLPKEKKEVMGKAGVGKEGVKMGGKAGTGVTKTFGKSSTTVVSQPISSKAEAEQMALGQYQDMAIAYITGEGKCQGMPSLRAGKVIEITGVGKRFSGLYYVVATSHHYALDQGYNTTFTVRRNAS